MLRQAIAEALKVRILPKIAPNEINPRNRLHLKQVDRNDVPLGPDPFGNDLGPAARRRPKIDHRLPRFQKSVALVELDELERGSRAVSLALSALNIGIVDVPLDPTSVSLTPRHQTGPRSDRSRMPAGGRRSQVVDPFEVKKLEQHSCNRPSRDPDTHRKR